MNRLQSYCHHLLLIQNQLLNICAFIKLSSIFFLSRSNKRLTNFQTSNEPKISFRFWEKKKVFQFSYFIFAYFNPLLEWIISNVSEMSAHSRSLDLIILPMHCFIQISHTNGKWVMLEVENVLYVTVST